VRFSLLTVVTLLVACDTMIDDHLLIKTPADVRDQVLLQERASTVRQTLASCGLQQTSGAIGGELWIWHDPEHPPDVQATVAVSWNRVNVHLVQGLYGPIGPTPKYREVKESLLKSVTQRYGKGSIEIE
jgi:hypothetical protein